MNLRISTRPIGKSSLRVTELGFGGAPLGNLYRVLADEEAEATVSEAFSMGFRYFDTAPYYGFGLGERRLGDVLRKFDRSSYVLSTKVGRLLQPIPGGSVPDERHGFKSPMPFNPVYDYSYDGIMRSVEASIQRLGLSHIDILLMHDIGEMTHGDKHPFYFKQAMEGGYRALDELREQGLIKAIGLGVNEYEVCEAAMEHGRFDCFLLAGRYTLLEQEALLTFLPKCERHGASVIAGGIFNSGVLAQGTRSNATPTYNYEPASPSIIDRVRKIEVICEAYDVRLAEAALQFPLAHPAVSCVIPGIGKTEYVRKTMDFFNKSIPASFWAALKDEKILAVDTPVPNQNSLAVQEH